MADIEDLVKNTSFTTAEPGKITFLPEPDRRARQFTVISVDDHIVEPPDTFEGRPILVRFVWSDMTATTCRWEQAFSTDDGATWEVNWIMESTRIV